jgi:hypothetical protein
VFEEGRVFELAVTIGLVILTYYYFSQADKGKTWFIRRIPGVDMIDEALERATELDRPVHFAVGDKAELSGMMVPQVIAGLECLQHIAAHCAKLRTKLIVTLCGRSGSGGDMVPITNDMVRDIYVQQGVPEDFGLGDTVRYVSGERPVYHAAMQRIFVEEQVCTNIMIGPWAGSIWAVTAFGGAQGIYQITGTALLWEMPEQSCVVDYFLIGEEIYAAGAVLSGDANAQASIKVQDWVKMFIWVVTITGVLALTAGSDIIKQLLNS